VLVCIINKLHLKFFLKAEVLVNKLEGFCLTANDGRSQSLRWEADARALSATSVCSASPAACFPPVELLGSTLSEVKDLSEHLEHRTADGSRIREGSAWMLLCQFLEVPHFLVE